MNSTPPLARLSTSRVFGRGVSDVLPDEVVARDGDHLRLVDVAKPMEDLRHLQRDGGLAGTGVAGERHVQRRARRLEPCLAAQLVDDEQRRHLADAVLDRTETDEAPRRARPAPPRRRRRRRGALRASRAGSRASVPSSLVRLAVRLRRRWADDRRELAALAAVALARRRVEAGVGVDRVADHAVVGLLALQAEAGLVLGTVDDERHRRRLAPLRAVVRDDLHVEVRVRLAARAHVAHRRRRPRPRRGRTSAATTCPTARCAGAGRRCTRP